MKIRIPIIILLLASCFLLQAGDVSDPQAAYLTDYTAGDSVKKFSIDVDGDGRQDWLFTTVEANPCPTARISSEQAGGTISWDTFVANAGGATFKSHQGIEIDGELIQGAGVDLNPDKMYAGNISEIKRYGLVTSEVKRAKTENSIIIYAFTWEGDHFKRWKLAEYVVDKQNAIADKYLKDGKRTHVTVQQIKP